ncbi:bifunctional folylpolyglutamate synthase/dihydrofolate synthase [Novosphingobium sp. G106]|uniref:bifunctional folylpolyglutamate synthase/dihydrofolate synthase n=1 Tax=Novosphingobium sp. G106 TaxID=2849500 RepID=UPI001C2D7829|nr:folylpolyglutamate synthase/dihydrofolate synthase family protein [Novosphingobium sp. G106]MBV1686484.1 bifunctional folylpolyglutamate synthase/dihydrofolate synthase [Novosphingobium sp. G106]
MVDFAISDDPEVQAQLDRLGALSLPQGRFGLETIREILARLGDPQKRLPPTFHVAGTNGKGSTCAYLRAMLEAQGLTVHAATKPHLVRYNERIRIGGSLISNAELAARLKQVLDVSADLGPSFFEVTAAATFLAFAEHPADACVIEVGLGGRFDATNVLEHPAACGIASLGIDHEAFLLRPEEGVPQEPLSRIAFEKAAIARPGAPLVTQAYPLDVAKTVIASAQEHGAKLAMRGLDWFADVGEAIVYRDARGELTLPLPALAGAHQADNAALAVAMLRHQDAVQVSPEAMAEGIRSARWPARLQLLGAGPLAALVPGREVWLDGGHNPDAGAAIARHFGGLKLHLVIGMLANKDPSAIVAPLANQLLSISVVPAPGHDAHAPEDFAPFTALPIRSFAKVEDALGALPPANEDDGGDVLIAGSLYLAGEVLRLNGEIPD